MPTALGYVHTTLGTVTSNGTDTFAEVVESASLKASNDYYIICHAIIEGSDSNELFEWRLIDRTNGDAVLQDSTMIKEPAQGTVTESYNYVGKVTTGTDGGGIEFQQRTQNTDETAKTRFVSMLLIDGSYLDAGDYVYKEDTRNVTLNNLAQQSLVQTDATTYTVGDKWAIFGCVGLEVDGTGHNSEIRMNIESDSASVATTPFMSFEGEDTSEYALWAMMRPYTIAHEDTIFELEGKQDSASGTANQKTYGSIFALNLSNFEDSYSSYSDTDTTTTSTGWQELDTTNFSPTTSGDVLVFGCAIADLDSTNRKSYARLQLDGTTSPNTQPDSYYGCNTRDSSSELPLLYLTSYSSTAGSAVQIDFDVKKESSADYGWDDYSLVAFSTWKVDEAPINYSAVAVSTYTSGSVAGSTYNSGSVASEVNPQ